MIVEKGKRRFGIQIPVTKVQTMHTTHSATQMFWLCVFSEVLYSRLCDRRDKAGFAGRAVCFSLNSETVSCSQCVLLSYRLISLFECNVSEFLMENPYKVGWNGIKRDNLQIARMLVWLNNYLDCHLGDCVFVSCMYVILT